jgi:hypothetical protein
MRRVVRRFVTLSSHRCLAPFRPFRTCPAYDCVVLVAGGSGVLDGVLLASAVVPPLIVVGLAWFFLRAGRRHDERERAGEGRAPQ